MNFIQFKTLLKDFPVFSVSDIRSTDPAFDRRRLTEWKYRGYIQKVAKGLYMFSDVNITENILFRVANILYSPSYISLETALSFYQLIPEITYGITSVSTRRTYHYNTPLTHFTYRTLSRSLFFGYTIQQHTVRLSSMEKAILDFLYLNPELNKPDMFESIRINREAFLDQLDETLFNKYLQRFKSNALRVRTSRFMEWMSYA